MKQEKETGLLSVQEELARMAAETPEMPADFHAGWMKAVEKERAEMPAEKPAGQSGRKKIGRQWKGLLSVAAVAVFLIGGTFLTRGKLRPEARLAQDGPEVSVYDSSDAGQDDSRAPEQEEAAQVLSALMAKKDRDADMAEEAANRDGENESEMAYSAPVMGAAAVSNAVGDSLKSAGAAAGSAAVQSTSAPMPAEWAAGSVEAAEEYAFETEEAAGFEAGEAADVSADLTEMEPEAEESDAASAFTEYMKDMGAFILAVLPYLAGAAALAAAVLLIRKYRKKKR